MNASPPCTASNTVGWRLHLLCAVMAAMAAGILVWVIPHGVVLGNDGFTYQEGARQILAGNGYTSAVPPAPLRPVTHFPPLYSLAIAAVASVAGGIQLATLIVNVACFAAVAWMVAALVGIASGGNLVLAGLAALGVIFSQHLLECFTNVYSEPLFLALSLGVMLALLAYASSRSVSTLIAASLLGGCTVLVRYSGLVWVAVVPLMVFLFTPAGWGRRLKMAVFSLGVALIPFLALVARNLSTAQSATNREMHIHLVGGAHFREGALVVGAWFLPWRLCTVSTGALAGIGAAIFFLGMIAWSWRRVPANRLASLLLLCGVFAGVYFAHLLAAISFLHYNTPMDMRIMSPLLVVMIGALGAVPALFESARLARAAMVGVVALFLVQVVRVVPWAKASRAVNRGIAGQHWQTQPAVKFLRDLPPETEIWSTHTVRLYVVLERPIHGLPVKRHSHTTALNPDAEVELQRIAIAAETSPAVLAYFPPLSTPVGYQLDGGTVVDLERFHDFSLEELRRTFRLEVLLKTKEMELYRIVGPVRDSSAK